MSESAPPVETMPAAKKEQPPWLAISLALIAVSGPITASIYGWASKDKELQLADKQKAGELALSAQQKQYEALDRAVDAKLPPESRRLVLRFLSQVPEDQRIRDWAKTELEDVEAKLKEAYERIATLESALGAASGELTESRATLASAYADLEKTRQMSDQATGAAKAEKEKALAEAQRQVLALKERVRMAELGKARADLALCVADGRRADCEFQTVKQEQQSDSHSATQGFTRWSQYCTHGVVAALRAQLDLARTGGIADEIRRKSLGESALVAACTRDDGMRNSELGLPPAMILSMEKSFTKQNVAWTATTGNRLDAVSCACAL